MTDTQPPGAQLAEARHHLGWSLRQAEYASGVPNSHISRIETGKIKHPGAEVTAKLAAAYGLDGPGRVVAERTTETTHTQRVTERFTIHNSDTAPINAIPGWGHGPTLLEQRQQHRTHLETQQERCLDFLWDVAVSGEMTADQTGSWDVFRHQLPELIDRAVTILTSGPKATPLELTTGRSV